MSGWDKREIKNAIIESASITFDRDCLTVWLHLDYGGGAQAFGGYVLLCGPDYAHRIESEVGPNIAGVFIERVMRLAGVDTWHALPGKTIRADANSDKVYGIGHIVRDDWFYPETCFAKLKSERAA